MVYRDYSVSLVTELINHADASRYVTMAGFTILVWDILSTFDDEVRFMWTAPRSFVKVLYFVNRYMTVTFQAFTIYQMSRLAVFSDVFCQWWMCIGGFVEVASLAMADLLLLFRLHALWGGQRNIVIITYTLYFAAYSCIASVGMVSAIQLFNHLYYDPYTRTCTSDFKPKGMSVIWSFALCCEILVFVLTAVKALRLRENAQMRSPVVKSLYGGQFMYYLIIIVVRCFNLVIWGALPPSLLWLGVFFIWAIVVTLVSRIMLHLRRSACGRAQPDESFFGETHAVSSTRIVWARRPNPTTTVDSSIHTISHVDVTEGAVEEGRRGEQAFELKNFTPRASRLWP